jgi:ABC-type cobalamin/Fe3+-siderophores transport system ATPase subunit
MTTRCRTRAAAGGRACRAARSSVFRIARALAQTLAEPILAAPTNRLDIRHQIGALKLVASLPINGRVPLHDLNRAATFCDAAIIMRQGKIVAPGAPDTMFTEALPRNVFRSRHASRPLRTVKGRISASHADRHTPSERRGGSGN